MKRIARVNNSLITNEKEMFKRYILRPDIYGPFRRPRIGGSDRTGLGYDVTALIITGSNTNTIQGAQASGYFNTACVQYAATGTGTSIGAGTNVAVAVQFPAQAQIAGCNVTGCSIVAYYTGNPLNVQGEVLFGTTIPFATSGVTYGGLYSYPGVIAILS